MSEASELALVAATALNRLHDLSARPDLSNVDDADFLAKATAAGVGELDPNVDYLDSMAAPYSAKWDAVSVGNGVISTTTSTGDTVSTTKRPFTHAALDVGKSLWAGTGAEGAIERTISSISGTSAIITPPYGSTGSSLQLLFGTDDTVAIQAAIDACANNEETGDTEAEGLTYVRDGIPIGKTLRMPSGRGAIVGNSVADYDGGKLSALIVRRRTGFVGAGVSFFGSALHLKPGSKGHVVGNENCESTTDNIDFLTVGNFTIYCYASNWNPLSKSGFRLSIDANNYDKTDTFNRLLAIHVYNAGEDGVYLAGRGELLAFDLNGFFCRRNGVRVEGLDDSRFYHVVAGGNDKAGLVHKGGGPCWFIGGKAYYNGVSGGAVDEDSCNVLIDTDNAYTGLVNFLGFEAQESRGSSFIIKARAKLLGCLALDPGRTTLGEGSLPDDIAGYKVKTVNANNVVFGDCSVGATLTNFGDAPGNLGNAKWALFIDAFEAGAGGPAKCKGDIYFDEHVVITTTALGNNPGTTTNGSAAVTVASTAHGLTTDNAVNITGLTDTGGIAAANLNGVRKVTVINANSYTFTAGANASSGATGGGASGSVDKIIAGVSFASGGGAKGGDGASNGRNTALKVNASACT